MEKKEIAVTVIIPVYNGAGYMEKCLVSVMRQIYPCFQVIIIDDGSTDDTEKIYDSFIQSDGRFSVIKQANRGLGFSRNVGIAAAKTKYITFLDADDWWEPDYLLEMIYAAEKTNADIAVCDIFYDYYVNKSFTDKKKSEIRMQPFCVMSPEETPDLINKARTFAWGKLYHLQLLKENGIEQPSHPYEDIAATPISVALSSGIARVNMPLYHYCKARSGSLSENAGNLKFIEKSLRLMWDAFESRGKEQHYKSALQKMTYSQLRFACRKNMEHGWSEDLTALYELCDEKIPGWRAITEYNVQSIGGADMEEVKGMLIHAWKGEYVVERRYVLVEYNSIEQIPLVVYQYMDTDVFFVKWYSGFTVDEMQNINKKMEGNNSGCYFITGHDVEKTEQAITEGIKWDVADEIYEIICK